MFTAATAIRVERHAFGPRLFLFGRRVHEWHSGVILLTAYVLTVVAGALPFASEGALVLFAGGVWLVGKDWRDLVPGQRDTAAWQFGFHRPPPPLRVLRHGDSLPALAASLAAFVALVNLIWALGPGGSWVDDVVPQVRPFTSVPVFHSLAVPAGVSLCLCAAGLLGRRRAAWALVFTMLVALGAFELAARFDVKEGGLSLAAAGLLFAGRRAFYVRQSRPVAVTVFRVLALVASASVAALTFVLLVVHSEPSSSAREGVSLILWQPASPIAFADEAGALPTLTRLLSILVIIGCAFVVMRRPCVVEEPMDGAARSAARALVRTHGSDTLAFFKLRRDIRYMFTADRRAFLGYRVEAGVLLLCGDPVGSPPALRDLLRQACGFAEEHGLRVAAVSVCAGLLPLYEEAGLRSLYVGDEAVVETARFSLDGRAIRKVRQSVNRLERAGYTIEIAELGALTSAEVAELERVAEVWRSGRPRRGFSMALDSLCADEHADTLVVSARDGSGTTRAFLHFAPAYGRPVVSLSAMCREPATPNGLTEFAVVKAIELLRARGISEVSLNFAAFARLRHAPQGRMEGVLGRVVAAANPYFQIESLYRFNAKFSPRWEPRYLVYEGRLGLPRAALATLWAEGQLARPALPPCITHAFSR